jgi:PAS domain S-box-containing protein
MKIRKAVSTSIGSDAKLRILAKEKEYVRRKLAVTAEKLQRKAWQLSVTAKQKEDVRRKLVVTAKKLRVKARQLAVTAKEKEDVRRKLVVTAKEKEDVRRKLAVTAKEKEEVRRKLAVTADELKLSRATLEKKVLERTKDLEQVKAKNEAILASIGDGLVATDTNERILLVNKAFERSLGWKREEVIGKLLSEVIPMADAAGNTLAAGEHLLMKSPRGHPDTAATMYYKRKDGTSFPVAITVAPIIAGNKLIGAVEVFRDNTKLKEIDKAKSEFMSIASHQLRTPLTAIRWALSSLKREDITSEQRRLISTAHETSSNMAVTIRRMLMISHLEEDDAEPEIAEVNLHTVVGKVTRLHDAHRERNGLELTVECPDMLLVQTDEQLLIEILDNLLSNAYKYTSRGGNVRLRVAKEGKNIRIDMTDTGCGIPLAEQKRIPEKFFRASNVASPAEAGTGIGLYMVYNIARVIGGTISFVSEENTGSTFTLLFPS